MFSIYFVFYLLTLVIALVNFKKFVDTPLRFFPLLIAYTLFNELLGYFIFYFEEFTFFDEEKYNWHNVIIYIIYHLIFSAYVFWLYHEVIKNKKSRKMVKVGAILTFSSYLISLFFQDPFHSDLYYADCVGCIVTIVIILLHLKEVKKTNGGMNRYNLMVWINWGMLIFNIYFPFYILNGYLNADFFLEYHLRQILWGVICIMYGLFTVGFLISKRSAFR